MLSIEGCEIEFEQHGSLRADRPCLVFLHEGLGSARLWRDVPARLAARLSLPALVYSRRGYGASTPFDGVPAVDYMHAAARGELPAVLRALGVRRPLLIGHSDGASIALIRAGDAGAHRAAGAADEDEPALVVAIAPHLFVEPICSQSISALAAPAARTALVARLAKYHRDPAATFDGWSRAWLSDGFANWNIEALAARVRCPVLAIQGDADRYGTLRQLDRLAACTPGSLRLVLPGVGHAPHLERGARVLDVIARWVGWQLAHGSEADR